MRWRINRRAVLAGALLPLASQAGAQADPYADQFISMEATVVSLLESGGNTQRFVFRTKFDQPILRAKQGQPITVRIANKLAEDVWLHFFGLRAEADAVTVLIPQNAEAETTITFTPTDAGTFWFGPLLKASRQREMGLQGLLIVDPAVPDNRYQDMPLILDDWLVTEDGKIEEDFGSIERAAGEGRLGNWYTVNGVFKPSLKLSGSKPTRLRILNACNSRTLSLQLKNADAVVLARDGHAITPLSLPTSGLPLAPGQRVDVAIAAVQKDQIILALDLFEDVVETAFLLLEGALPALPEPIALPANPLPVVDLSLAPREVPILLEGGIKGGLTKALVGTETLDLRTMLERGLAWSINGVAGPSGVPTFEAAVGETLILAFDNKTIFDQPLALHGHLWHQLDLDGQQTPGQSWRDTAVIPALSTARYVMVAERAGVWALHSLVAERSDAGLFGGFKVLDKP